MASSLLFISISKNSLFLTTYSKLRCSKQLKGCTLFLKMNLKAEILKEHSYENSEKLAWDIMENPHYLNDLFQLFWENDYRITQRATWAIIIITEWKPKLIKPFVEKMILTLKMKAINDSIKRNTVRILAEFPIPLHMEGEITEICFGYLNNPAEAIAIKVFSMTILERMVEKHPELKAELIYAIETGMEFGSAGYRSRGGKILTKLRTKPTVMIPRKIF